ncbi:tRNA (adenosine(37)-N6)-threonylcarbamoyltransferase complex dimerization subunit type 1 TsaB [Streptacidiphilus sp. PB12-B1b]|uniref:tRNA (adenosine(37)-N6)-threonylcarbamoyltransferase complex dimerization subunit type 1 TsaB n=1 Tax=Streptacidiphilus sp. PB12-B1b TaxID=2705012 RepID=UPI0015FAE198|nr:tRNA (adenosine(37)-N6)-threonylcarbamoyltransferase complex dimerization subunit type 1 TsaB [Streptacidiphilus sp. PB12-B1b]QMU79297.1 tRNA (adenosine(37)-N6)-threonylcarbamoyltransferase complex dimerization subunit type 1 TsaB [Streptacidiphilus sp. PB12-B1b]
MLLLAFDTATPAVTAALHDTERQLTLASCDRIDARRHGELLLPAVDEVLRTAGAAKEDLGGIAVGTGPGPYTGLRVGLATAAALGHALGIPVYGVCTLDGVAHAARTAGLTGPFVAATDARRKEVYWACYDAEGRRTSGPDVDRPADIAERVAGLPAVGAGALLYPEVFRQPAPGMPEHQSAAALADWAARRLAAGEALLEPVPLYLRRPDAEVPKNYKTVLPA